MAHNSIALPVPPRHTGKRIPMRIIRALVNHIAQNFDPDQIILFGSHAYGEPEAWSDVDLLVVKDVPRDKELETALEIRQSLPERSFGLDILVRSREVIEARKAWGDWFLHEITAKGKVMYERDGLLPGNRSQDQLSSEVPAPVFQGKPQHMDASELNPLTKEWVSLSESSFKMAWIAMKDTEQPLVEITCFHAQQCAEKYLKAYLTEKQVRFPRQRRSIPLMHLCLTEDPGFATIENDLEKLEGHAVGYRYPGAKITLEMAQASLAGAKRVRAFVRSKLGLSEKPDA